MNEQSTPKGDPAQQAGPKRRAVSDPREVANLVLARMNAVGLKKDELTMSINNLVELTQQLARTYAEQVVAIEQLRRRVKALEGETGPSGAARKPESPPLQ